eukprot:gene27075-2307_t
MDSEEQQKDQNVEPPPPPLLQPSKSTPVTISLSESLARNLPESRFIKPQISLPSNNMKGGAGLHKLPPSGSMVSRNSEATITGSVPEMDSLRQRMRSNSSARGQASTPMGGMPTLQSVDSLALSTYAGGTGSTRPWTGSMGTADSDLGPPGVRIGTPVLPGPARATSPSPVAHSLRRSVLKAMTNNRSEASSQGSAFASVAGQAMARQQQQQQQQRNTSALQRISDPRDPRDPRDARDMRWSKISSRDVRNEMEQNKVQIATFSKRSEEDIDAAREPKLCSGNKEA